MVCVCKRLHVRALRRRCHDTDGRPGFSLCIAGNHATNRSRCIGRAGPLLPFFLCDTTLQNDVSLSGNGLRTRRGWRRASGAYLYVLISYIPVFDISCIVDKYEYGSTEIRTWTADLARSDGWHGRRPAWLNQVVPLLKVVILYQNVINCGCRTLADRTAIFGTTNATCPETECNGAPVWVHQWKVWVRKLYCKPFKVQPQYHTLI